MLNERIIHRFTANCEVRTVRRLSSRRRVAGVSRIPITRRALPVSRVRALTGRRSAGTKGQRDDEAARSGVLKRPPHMKSFPPRPSNTAVVKWWLELNEYVRKVRELFSRRQCGSFAEWWHEMRGELGGLWETTDLGQKPWSVRRVRIRR